MVRYDEVDRLMPEGSLTVPNHRTDTVKGEWDWYYQLSPANRRRILRHCQPNGIDPDSCAHAAGYDDVDEWAADLVAAVTDLGDVETGGAELVAAGDLVGPVEAAQLCGVEVATIRQWVKRGVMPAELVTVSGVRLWNRADIELWHAERVPTAEPADAIGF